MLDQAIDTVSNHSWVPSSAWRRLENRKAPHLLEDVPVMSATVLALEMLLHEPCIDLRIASELILSDVGATIQVLRLVGSEYECTAEHPCRMGDCLASLEAGDWFAAISSHTFPSDRDHAAITQLWNHCRLVAHFCQLFAESLDGVLAEEAYLIGLLHEIDQLPTVLGCPSSAVPAIQECLPLFVLAALHSLNEPGSSSPWKSVLAAAHELAQLSFASDHSRPQRLMPAATHG